MVLLNDIGKDLFLNNIDFLKNNLLEIQAGEE